MARNIVKLSVLRRKNVIIVEVRIRGDTDCAQGVSTWPTTKRAGDNIYI